MKGSFVFLNRGTINSTAIGAERKAKAGTRHKNRIPDAERDKIAALIRQGLPLSEVSRKSRHSMMVVQDVQADMWIGKHGGYK